MPEPTTPFKMPPLIGELHGARLYRGEHGSERTTLTFEILVYPLISSLEYPSAVEFTGDRVWTAALYVNNHNSLARDEGKRTSQVVLDAESLVSALRQGRGKREDDGDGVTVDAPSFYAKAATADAALAKLVELVSRVYSALNPAPLKKLKRSGEPVEESKNVSS